MKILGVANGEFEMHTVERRLKEAGLLSRYEGHIQGGERALVMVSVRDVAEKEQVRGIFEKSGVVEVSYREDEPPTAGN